MEVYSTLLAAAPRGSSLLVVIVPIVLVGAVLIGAFVWGSRRRARRAEPPVRPGTTVGPRAGSWREPGRGGPDGGQREPGAYGGNDPPPH